MFLHIRCAGIIVMSGGGHNQACAFISSSALALYAATSNLAVSNTHADSQTADVTLS